MVTEQLHIPIDAWLSGKISIGPRRDPQIMNNFQMQVMDVRSSSCLHHGSWWFLLFDCLSKLTYLRTTGRYGSATNSIFQAVGTTINCWNPQCAWPRSYAHWHSLFSARGHWINRIKSMDYLRITFYFHRMPLSTIH